MEQQAVINRARDAMNRANAEDRHWTRDEMRDVADAVVLLCAEVEVAQERAARVPELVSECRSLRERLKDACADRDAARAEVERIGAEYAAATAQANATLDKYRAEVERANVAARDARVEAKRWSAADSAALAAVTADHGILLAELDEANTALDEAGEPRDDGEGVLSLASRIARLTAKVAALREVVTRFANAAERSPIVQTCLTQHYQQCHICPQLTCGDNMTATLTPASDPAKEER